VEESEIAATWPKVEFAVRPIPESKARGLMIAAVDGSRSPMPTRRLGGDFAVYSAGLLKLRGNAVLENRFAAGKVDSIYPQPVDISSLLSARSLAAEREVAASALQGSDLVLLDGSFYGFAGEVISTVRGRAKEETQRLGDWSRAVRLALERTKELIESGRCVGVIKRSQTRAVSGWLSMKKGLPILTGLRDKRILSRRLPPKSSFDYDVLLSGESPLVYSVLAYDLARRKEKPGTAAFERATALTMSRFEKAFERPFGVKVPVSKLTRIQARLFPDASPCELEVPTTVSKDLLNDLLTTENFSEATGLPHAIDMIDEYVGIPRAFTRDFVQEVEARVASLSPATLAGVRSFFSGLNPQKETIE
jgi:hypothetical protein